jgi:hypothetical protein
MENPKDQELKPDTGYLRLEGSDVKLKIGTPDPIANTALLLFEAVRSPLTTVSVVPPRDDPAQAITDPAARTARPGFGIALLAVTAITILAFIAVLVMSVTLPNPPNATQIKAFDISADAFCAGMGALIGLITGKAI